MTTFVLRSDNDSINMIAPSTYELMEDSLEISPPERDDVRMTNHRKIAGRTLRYSAYRPRKISFKLWIRDTSDNAASASVQRLSRMISRASDETILQGGMYDQALTMGSVDSGDQGVVLQFSLGPSVNTSITNESTFSSGTDDNTYTARVISGDVTQTSGLSRSTRQYKGSDGTTYRYREVQVDLEVEPMFLKKSRIVGSAVGSGLVGGPVSPSGSGINRIFVPAANVPGDADALTRISTQINGGQGLIIARDAGVSLLNSTSTPVYSPASGSTYNDMFCYGDTRNNTGKTYQVKISANSPDKFQYRVNGGSYSSSITIQAATPIQLGSDPVYVYFWTNTGHIINDTWTFNNNQAYFATSISVDAYANRSNLYDNDGMIVAGWSATVPPGCTSKYKVLALYNASKSTEFTMTANFIGYGGPAGRVTTGSQTYDWVLPPNNTGYVDLGIIDLSPSASPFTLYPGLLTEIGISMYARTVETLGSGDTIGITGMYLIPCQDEYAYFHAVWSYDGYGHEVFCNYDPNNPYIMEVSVNGMDASNSGFVAGTALNATYAGNVITLIPGVDNTVMFLPIFSALGVMDWRAGSFISNSQVTGNTYIAIRPRFLQV